MGDLITRVTTWLYLSGPVAIFAAAASAIVFMWLVLRALYGQPERDSLSTPRLLVAMGGLGALILIPVPLMYLMRSGASAETSVGWSLYRSNCQVCHGDKGNRLPGVSLGSKAFLDALGDAELGRVIREGKGVMPAWGKDREGPLDNEHIDMILLYLKSSAEPGPPPGGLPKVGASPAVGAGGAAGPGDGKELFAQNCASCHGAKGDQYPNSNLAARDFLQARGEGLAKTIAEGKGTMPSFGGKLSSAQIGAIVEFLQAQAGQ